MKWTEFKPSDSLVEALTGFKLTQAEVEKWLDTYIAKYREGMKVFYPWYAEQRYLYRTGRLVMFPPFPHEVFPDLFAKEGSEHVEAAEEFYDEFRVYEQRERIR